MSFAGPGGGGHHSFRSKPLAGRIPLGSPLTLGSRTSSVCPRSPSLHSYLGPSTLGLPAPAAKYHSHPACSPPTFGSLVPSLYKATEMSLAREVSPDPSPGFATLSRQPPSPAGRHAPAVIPWAAVKLVSGSTQQSSSPSAEGHSPWSAGLGRCPHCQTHPGGPWRGQRPYDCSECEGMF